MKKKQENTLNSEYTLNKHEFVVKLSLNRIKNIKEGKWLHFYFQLC